MKHKMRVGVIGAGSWAVGSHLPNLGRWRDVIAAEPRASEVHAFSWAPPGAAVELHDAIAVRFANGLVGTIGSMASGAPQRVVGA